MNTWAIFTERQRSSGDLIEVCKGGGVELEANSGTRQWKDKGMWTQVGERIVKMIHEQETQLCG